MREARRLLSWMSQTTQKQINLDKLSISFSSLPPTGDKKLMWYQFPSNPYYSSLRLITVLWFENILLKDKYRAIQIS